MSACTGGPLTALSIAVIWLYRYSLAGILGGQCRFYPTCSRYASEALRAHGFLMGWALALKRLARCQPWSVGGEDPVPSVGHCRTHGCGHTRTHQAAEPSSQLGE